MLAPTGGPRCPRGAVEEEAGLQTDLKELGCTSEDGCRGGGRRPGEAGKGAHLASPRAGRPQDNKLLNPLSLWLL